MTALAAQPVFLADTLCQCRSTEAYQVQIVITTLAHTLLLCPTGGLKPHHSSVAPPVVLQQASHALQRD